MRGPELRDRNRPALAKCQSGAAGGADPRREDARIRVDLLVKAIEEIALDGNKIPRLIFAEELRNRIAAFELVDRRADA